MHLMMDAISEPLKLRSQYSLESGRSLKSCFAVSDLAEASMAAVGCAMADYCETVLADNIYKDVTVNRRLASLWFAQSFVPTNWEMPPIWDDIAGLYQTSDGWIRLHTNLPHHRCAALDVLAVNANRDSVSAAIKKWQSQALESAIVSQGGVAAKMRSQQQWRAHPQGLAITDDELVNWLPSRSAKPNVWKGSKDQPLKGLKVLDLTRVLAGPVATRTLAGFGAQVLRIDPPKWDEMNVVPDITLGKRAATIDLKTSRGRSQFSSLLAQADVFVHGYRADALASLGLGTQYRNRIAPNVIDVQINAYGWNGPWVTRRGFDSLVQMSCGIAETGMTWSGSNKPHPLPVQALDHATGYLMAATVIKSLELRQQSNIISSARLSLAKTADLLMKFHQPRAPLLELHPLKNDFQDQIETMPWGNSHRLLPGLKVGNITMNWDLPACALGSSAPEWR